MIFHENRLLADDSHEISYLIFLKMRKYVAKLSSVAVVTGALRIKMKCFLDIMSWTKNMNAKKKKKDAGFLRVSKTEVLYQK